MNVKERIISLRLVEKENEYSKFYEDVGIIVSKKKEKNNLNNDCNYMEDDDYEKVHSK